MNNLKKYNYKIIIFFTITILLIILGRVIFLDADLPASISLLNLYPIDEGFYTQPAFNLYNYGKLTHETVPYITGDAGVADLFQTILTYLSLLIFGNNYYGVRMPSVFISLVTIWLFYLTLENIKPSNSKSTNYSIFFIMLYFITDFEYLSISRIWVPTVFRTFFITLIVYLFSLYYKKTCKDFLKYRNIYLLSFLSMSSVSFIYIYNLFIYSATIFTIFLVSLISNWKTEKKQIIKDSLLIVLGSLTSIILFIIYLFIFYNQTLLDFFLSLTNYGNYGKSGINMSLPLHKLLIFPFITLYNNLSTNIFRFNIILLFLFLLLLPVFIKSIKKRVFNIFIISLLVFQYLQTIFENTFFYRRLTVILPIVLIIIFLVLTENYKNIKLKKTKEVIYITLTILLSIFIFYTQNITNTRFGGLLSKPLHGYNGNLTIFFITISIIFLLLALYFFINKKVLLLLFTMLILNIYFLLNYTYYKPTFNYRNSMIDLSKKVNNEIITGKLSYSFRFYNSYIPVLNFYKYYGKNSNKYSKKITRLFYNKHSNLVIQNAYRSRFNIKNSKNSTIQLNLKNVYYVGNGLYITLLDVKLIKRRK